MIKEFKKHITTNFPELLTQKLLIACSGGVDSVVLVELCAALSLEYSLAHCNFMLRGDESDGDEVFVRNLGKRLNKKVYATSFDTNLYAKIEKLSTQIAARELRYQWFDKLMDTKGYQWLLTAHHADDNVETVVINLSRGTGIEGLKGIPKRNNKYCRPILPFTRAAIVAYAKETDIKWREDSSNASIKYLRNKIRHQILPVFKELHPTVMDNFNKTISHLEDVDTMIGHYVQQLKKELFVVKESSVYIDIVGLKNLSPLKSYMYYLFKAYGFTDFDALILLFDGISGKQLYSKTHRVIKDREQLIISPILKENNDIYTIHEDDIVVTEPISLQFLIVEKIEEKQVSLGYFDKEKLQFPLTLRKIEEGDVFYPSGMRGKKKISKFYKDEKYSLLAKEQQWLLCSDNNIIWVVGKRIDDRFKVTEDTKTIVRIKYNTNFE